MGSEGTNPSIDDKILDHDDIDPAVVCYYKKGNSSKALISELESIFESSQYYIDDYAINLSKTPNTEECVGNPAFNNIYRIDSNSIISDEHSSISLEEIEINCNQRQKKPKKFERRSKRLLCFKDNQTKHEINYDQLSAETSSKMNTELPENKDLIEEHSGIDIPTLILMRQNIMKYNDHQGHQIRRIMPN